MAGHGEKLTRKQEVAVAALLSEPTIKRAAERVGVGEKTLRLWLDDPGFKRSFAEARRQILTVAVARLVDGTSEAVTTLREALTTEKASDRIAAARTLLDQALKATELLDLNNKVAELEQLLADLQGARDERQKGYEPAGRRPDPAPGARPGEPDAVVQGDGMAGRA